MKKPKSKVSYLIFLTLLISCVESQEEPTVTEIPVDSYWMYSFTCLDENVEDSFSQQNSMRITNPEDFEVLASCNVELPEVDFSNFFLLATRFESMGFPIFRDQGFYRIGDTDLEYKIKIDISDFTGRGVIYCFGIIPNEFAQQEISVEIQN
ncbi:hypothetical protein [Lunatibacter salilacus]|uniref:hypothetical protein n=1 Tax=Lunatibacter salilacus TaxID=2483804 RepID=UPI00131A82D3|nr:hypothetical protein [Lunatibacter salilacus]